MVKCYFKTLLTNLNYYQMKKSLLGFLALAGVLVGCQNYDDQFDALNQQILELQTELDGLTDIETDLAALVSDLSDLSDTVQDIEDNALTGNDLTTALSGVLTTLQELRTRLAALETDVENIDVEAQVASATADIDSEVADLNEEIERIEAALRDLLEASAVIDQDLNIRNQAELAYAKTLFPSDVTINAIVRGNVNITIGTSLQDSLAVVDALTDRIATVVRKTGMIRFDIDNDATGELSFDALTFIDGDAVLEGNVDINNVATIANNLVLTTTGDVAYPNLTSVQDINFTSGTGITSVDLSNITGVSGDVYTGTTTTSLVLPSTSVQLGTLAIPATVNVSGTFDSDFDGDYTGTIDASAIDVSANLDGATLTAATNGVVVAGTVSGSTLTGNGVTVTGNISGATTIAAGTGAAGVTGDLSGVVTVTGNSIAVTGNSAATGSFTSSTTLSISGNVTGATTAAASGTTVGTINLASGVATFDSSGSSFTITGATISATTVTIDANTFTGAAVTALTGAITINDAAALTLDAVTSQSGSLVAPDAATVNLNGLTSNETITAGSATTFSADSLVTSGTITIAADATVTLESIAALADLPQFNTINDLTLTNQATDLSVATAVRLADFTLKGKAGSDLTAQDNDITVTAANVSLTSLSISDGSVLSSLNINGSTLESLTTNGKIRVLDVQNNTDLTSFAFGHGHIQPGNASTVVVSGNVSLTSLNLSSLTKVATITIVGNTDLAQITAPTVSSNPNEMATGLAPIGVSITGNGLAATYTDATAATGTTSYVMSTFSTSAISGFRNFIEYYLDQASRSASVTFAIEFGFGSGDTPAADVDAQAGEDGVAGNADDQLINNNNQIDGDGAAARNRNELLLLSSTN